MPSGELGQSSGSDLYCSVVQAVTTGQDKCYPVVSGCSQRWKSTCKRERFGQKGKLLLIRMPATWRDSRFRAPKTQLWRLCLAMKVFKVKGDESQLIIEMGGHSCCHPPLCRLLCRFVDFLQFSAYAIVFTQLVCGLTEGKKPGRRSGHLIIIYS